MFSFDAQHTNYNSYEHILSPTNVSRLVLDWTANTAKPLLAQPWSSPTVANGVVYVGSGDGKLYAFNAASGAVLWSATPDSGVDTRIFATPLYTPAVANGVVYVDLGDFKVFAFHLPG